MFLGGTVPNSVFENDQDTYLFASALQSALLINDPHQVTQPLFQICSQVLEESVKTITRNETQKIWDENMGVIEVQEKKIATGQRLNAVAFFSLLRDLEIVCPEANAYYESIAYDNVSMNSSLYISTCHQSGWSEFFIECARQLPPDALATVCKRILELSWDDGRQIYTYHILLQTIIWKFFILDDPTIIDQEDNQETHRFDFPFVVPNSKSSSDDEQANSSSTNELLEVYEILLNTIFSRAQPEFESFDVVKLVLHAYKLIFKLLKQVKMCNLNFVNEVFKLNPLLERYYPHIRTYKPFPKKNQFCVEDPCYKLAAWEINEDYLRFLFNIYLEKVEQLSTEKDSFLSKIPLPVSVPKDQKEWTENIFPIKDYLKDSNSTAIDLLIAIIQYKYAGAAKSAEVILLHPELLILDKILITLENNIPLLCHWKNYVSVLNAITTIEVEEVKLRLLNLFYSMLSHGPDTIYNDVLKYMVTNWGFSENFKLPEFNEHLTQFTRKTHSYEEAKTSLLPLFLQSPLTVSQTVIQQALMQGTEGMGLIRVLKHIPVICNEEHMKPLFSEICEYFIRNQHPVEELKNMELLIQTLMEVHAEENFLSFDAFMKCCILPTLTLANFKLEISLNCLNTALRVLNEKDAVSVSDAVMMSYLIACAGLLNASIQSGSGKIKELVIEGLYLMHEHFKTGRTLDGQTIVALHSKLEKYNPAVFIYFNKFIGKRAYEALRSSPLEMNELLWTWCCFTNDEDLLQDCITEDKFSYAKLLNTLVLLHNHFSMEEWIESTHFIKECCSHLHSSIVPSTMPWKLSESDYHLYAAIRCLIDCLYFIFDQEVITEIYYISSCFTNTVMNLLNSQDVQPELLLYIFLDMCHLSSVVEEDILTIFSSFLIGLIKSIYSTCKNESQQKIYMKLFSHAVLRLPDSEEKQSLLQKFE